MAERDDVGDTVANNQVMDSRLLFPPDDDDGPDVHHEGHYRAGDVASTRYMLSLSFFNILVGSLLDFLQADARGAGEPDQHRLRGPSW